MDYYDQVDYMTQLATDMSLDDSSGLYWNINDFEPIMARISALELIVNDYLMHRDGNSPDLTSNVEIDGESDSEFISSSYVSEQGNALLNAMLYNRTSAPMHHDHFDQNMQGSTVTTDIFDEAIAKLNWYKNKIVESIETADTSEVNNECCIYQEKNRTGL